MKNSANPWDKDQLLSAFHQPWHVTDDMHMWNKLPWSSQFVSQPYKFLWGDNCSPINSRCTSNWSFTIGCSTFPPTQITKNPKTLTEHKWKRGLYRNNLESFITYKNHKTFTNFNIWLFYNELLEKHPECSKIVVDNYWHRLQTYKMSS